MLTIENTTTLKAQTAYVLCLWPKAVAGNVQDKGSTSLLRRLMPCREVRGKEGEAEEGGVGEGALWGKRGCMS